MKIKTVFLSIAVILLALSLRLYRLNQNPPGLYSDEAAYLYNAYSLLKTGRDEYGVRFPLAFKSFGEYKAPLYIYAAVPLVKIFGLRVEAVRYLSVALSLGTIMTVFLLIDSLYGSKAGLLAGFMLTVMPQSLQFSRMGHEGNLSAFLLFCGLAFLLKDLKNKRIIVWPAVLFGLSMYAHHDAKLLAPLFIIAGLYLWLKKGNLNVKSVILSIVVFTLLALPLLTSVFNKSFWSRPIQTSIFSDPGIVAAINSQRGEDVLSGFTFRNLYHNKLVTYVMTFAENYGRHLSWDFLFFNGDNVQIYKAVNSGVMLMWMMPFFYAGIYFFLRRRDTAGGIFIYGFLISIVVAALTRYVPSASRMQLSLPFMAIYVALGLMMIIEQIKYPLLKRVFILFVIIVLAFNLTFYFHNYYSHTPLRYAKEWHFGMDEVYGEIIARQDEYKTVWLSKSAWGYIYALVFLKYPPEKYQPQANLSEVNEYGFGWVRKFDKYVFDDFPEDFTVSDKTLYIGSPEDFLGGTVNPLKTITYPDGQPAFYVTDRTSFPYEQK